MSIDTLRQSTWSRIARRAALLGVAVAAIGPAGAGAVAARSAAPVTPFSIPTPTSGLAGIATAPDGSIWFTETSAGKIGRIQPNGEITDEGTPTDDSGPDGITVASNGTVWFTESLAGRIGEVAPDGTLTEYPIPGSIAPSQIAVGPDGNVWFTEPAADEIGTLTLSGGTATFTQHPIPTPGSEPGGIASGPGGSLYFTEAAVAHEQNLGAINTAGTFAAIPLPNIAGGAGSVVVAPDGGVWFTEPESPSGGGIETVGGTVGEYFVPAGTSTPNGVAVGPDGSVWFNAPGSGTIGWISLTTVPSITAYQVAPDQPAASVPSPNTTIVAGLNDTLWLAEPGANEIERVTLTPPAVTVPASLSLTPGQAASVTVTSSGWPVPSLTEAGPLPDGVTFHDNGDGTATISGTPGADTAGHSYPVTVTGTNSFATAAAQAVAISVSGAPPSATVPTTTTPTTSTPPSPTTSSTTDQPGRARVTRIRVSGALVRVTVTCTGAAGQHCAMVARLKVPHMVTTVRRTLAAGQRHTFTLRPGAELARRLGHAGVHVRSTLTISESGSNGRTHTIVHRTLKL